MIGANLESVLCGSLAGCCGEEGLDTLPCPVFGWFKIVIFLVIFEFYRFQIKLYDFITRPVAAEMFYKGASSSTSKRNPDSGGPNKG